MPLYNEAEYLREALESLLAQQYQNFEILLSDNASADATAKICEEYAAKDARISFTNHPENIGAMQNFTHLVHKAKGKYFFWAAGHDLWDPTFISECVSVLEADNSIVLAYPQTQRIKADGTPFDVYPSNIDTRGKSVVHRYKDFVWHVDCNLVYGIWRLECLKQSGCFRDVYSPDQVLIAEMALKGSFAKIQKPLWLRRYQRGEESSLQKKDRILEDLKPDQARERQKTSLTDHYRHTRNAQFTVINTAELGAITKLMLKLHTWLSFAVRCNVFPGALIGRRIVRVLLPMNIQRKIIGWLRTG
jgi:glycosyltransferase involved in cell wall biosynthesis